MPEERILARVIIPDEEANREIGNLWEIVKLVLKVHPEKTVRMQAEIRNAIYEVLNLPAPDDKVDFVKSKKTLAHRIGILMRKKEKKEAARICREVYIKIYTLIEPLLQPDSFLESITLSEEALKRTFPDLPLPVDSASENATFIDALNKKAYKYAGNLLYVDFMGILRLNPDISRVKGKRRPILLSTLCQHGIPIGKKLSDAEKGVLERFINVCQLEMASELGSPP